jgi:hypothetical protein
VLVDLFDFIFLACGDTRPQGRRNWKPRKLQISFLFLSRKRNTRKKERKNRSKNGPFEDSKKLPTSRSACEDLESERALWDFRKPRLSLFEQFCDLFVLFLPPEVTSDRFIYYWGGGFRFASIVCFFFLRLHRSLGLFIGGWSCIILIIDSSPKCSESH